VVFLDDSDVGVQGARQTGMTAIRFTDNEQAVGELDNHLA
jgi:beta-phosphoglucomutase-like phosphatase (HAD superfamily)